MLSEGGGFELNRGVISPVRYYSNAKGTPSQIAPPTWIGNAVHVCA